MEVLHLGSNREVDALIRTQYNNSHPTYFRLSDHPHAIETNLEFGKGTLLKNEGAQVTVMTAGPILGNVMEACRDLPVNLVYFHTLKPIDKALIERFRDTEILVVHDAYGLHEAIAEVPALRMIPVENFRRARRARTVVVTVHLAQVSTCSRRDRDRRPWPGLPV